MFNQDIDKQVVCLSATRIGHSEKQVGFLFAKGINNQTPIELGELTELDVLKECSGNNDF